MNERLRQAQIGLTTGIYGPALPWPAPTPEVAAQIVLGAKPRDLAPGLTRAEAHRWATQDAIEDPRDWLWSQVVAEYKEVSCASAPKDMAVLRWARKILADPQRRKSAKRRDVAIMGDDTEGSVWDRLDEITAADLRASPWETIAAASARQAREMWDGPDDLAPPLEAELPNGVENIRTFSRLFREGAEMRHCVASYAHRIHSGECLIMSLRHGNDRSTAMFVNGRAREHRAKRNESPSEACEELARQIEQALSR